MFFKMAWAAGAVFLAMGVILAQNVRSSIDGLISQLGSSSFQEREAAMRALLDRPDAENKLRAAIQSNDAEIATRAAKIVREFEDRPFRELDDAIAHGRIERATDLIATWPVAKAGDAFWRRVANLSLKFIDPMGPSFEPNRKKWEKRPTNGGAGGRLTSYDFDPTTRLRMHNFFLRADEIDLALDPVPARDKKWDPGAWSNLVAFSAGRLGIRREELIGITAFAGADVRIAGNMQCCLVVAGGEATIDGGMSSCLVIAKGTVTWTKPLGGSVRIISGKNVVYDRTKTLPNGVVISENDGAPLGYIRWSDAPKDKAAPKAK